MYLDSIVFEHPLLVPCFWICRLYIRLILHPIYRVILFFIEELFKVSKHFGGCHADVAFVECYSVDTYTSMIVVS